MAEEAAKTPEQVAEIEKQQLLRDYRETFTTPAGKNVLFDLVKRCGVMENRFQADNERMDCFLSGRRSVGHEILEFVNFATIDGYYEFKRHQIEQMKKNSIVGRYFNR